MIKYRTRQGPLIIITLNLNLVVVLFSWIINIVQWYKRSTTPNKDLTLSIILRFLCLIDLKIVVYLPELDQKNYPFEIIMISGLITALYFINKGQYEHFQFPGSHLFFFFVTYSHEWLIQFHDDPIRLVFYNF